MITVAIGLAVLGFVLVVVGGYVSFRQQLDVFARATVAAVYRAGLRAAEDLGSAGIVWLRSPEGVSYRKRLASDAYSLLPAHIGPVPVGLVKLFVSQEQFCSLVERAFSEIADLARELRPDESPVAELLLEDRA